MQVTPLNEPPPRQEPRQQRGRLTGIALVVVGAVVLSTLTVLGLRWEVSRHAPHHAYQATGLGFTRLHKAAPAVALPNLDGAGTVSLTKLSGKPIVLNFWSSTCGPCKKETPALASVDRALGGQVTFVGIDSVDQHQHALTFADKYQVPYPIAFDPQGTAAIHYGVVALPVTVFLSPSGKTILGENIGALTATRLKAILHELYRTA